MSEVSSNIPDVKSLPGLEMSPMDATRLRQAKQQPNEAGKKLLVKEESLREEKQNATEEAKTPRLEEQGQTEQLKALKERFGELDGYKEFEVFLQEKLSPAEQEAFFKMIEQQSEDNDGVDLEMEFEMSGFPLNRQSYTIFADTFKIPTSTKIDKKEKNLNNQTAKNFLSALPKLQGIKGVPEVNKLNSLLSQLKGTNGEIAREKIDAINSYLIGPDGKSGELDNILTALKTKDQDNATKGVKTSYFETFTQSVRDFSPEVARRIDTFVENYELPAGESSSEDIHKQALIKGAIPEGAEGKVDGEGNVSLTSKDGTKTEIKVDGKHISRSLDMPGADYPLETPIQQADFSDAVQDYESTQQDLAPKKQHTERALAFLENPLHEKMTLEEMKVPALLKLLGHELYNSLGVRELTDKAALVSVLKTNLGTYKQELASAKVAFEKSMNDAIKVNQDRYAITDRKHKETLKILKNSGLGLWDIEYLVSQMNGQTLIPDLGDNFNGGDINVAEQKFGQPDTEDGILCRFVNKGLTGSPDGLDQNGSLFGINLGAVRMNPTGEMIRDSKLKEIIKTQGVGCEKL